MSNVLKIGRYQVENLINNQVRFHYFDLRDPKLRETEAPGHPLLSGSHPIDSSQVLSHLRSIGAPHDAPIVLLAESGSQEAKSVVLAQELEENSFMNVYVVDGGSRALLFD